MGILYLLSLVLESCKAYRECESENQSCRVKRQNPEFGNPSCWGKEESKKRKRCKWSLSCVLSQIKNLKRWVF